MGYQYILFDWDGCLAMTLEVWLNAWKDAFSKEGMKLTDMEITGIWSGWQKATDLGVSEEHSEAFTKRLFDDVEKGVESVALYDGARELLMHLKKDGRKLALITSSERRILNVVLKKNKIEHLFDVLICANDITNFKPHPEVIHKALDALGGVKSGSIIVGDSKVDLGAASNAGIDSLLFYPDSHRVFYKLEDLKKYNPTYIVKSFKEMEKIL